MHLKGIDIMNKENLRKVMKESIDLFGDGLIFMGTYYACTKGIVKAFGSDTQKIQRPNFAKCLLAPFVAISCGFRCKELASAL